MPTRTIANGGGNYNATGTWVEGAVPTSADDVVATATSGNLTVNVSSACRSIDLTNYVATLTVSSTLTIGTTTTIASNIGLKFVPAMTLAGSAGGFTFANSSATPHTIDFGGKTVLTAMTVNSNATIASDFTSSSTISHTGRTLDINGKAVVCTAFSDSGATTRTLTMSSGSITATLANAVAFTFAGSNLTLSAAGSTMTMSGANAGFSCTHTNLTFGTLAITGSGLPAIAGVGANMTFVNLTRTGTATVNDGLFLPATTINVTGTFTMTGAASNQRIWVTPGTRGNTAPDNGVTATIALSTTGTGALTNVDFMDVTVTGTNTPISGTRVGDALGNTGITFDASRSLFWVGGTGTWSNTAKWATSSGGAGGQPTPLPQDDVTIDPTGIGANNQTITCDTNRLCRDITMSSFFASGALTGTTSIFGSATISTTTSIAMSTQLVMTLRGRSSHTLSMTAFSARLFAATTIIAPGGTYTVSSSSVFFNGACTLISGTLALGANQLTLNGTFTSNSGLTRVIDTGTGVISNLFGGLTLTSAALTVTGTGTFRWAATSGTPTLLTGGVTLPNIDVNGAGQTVTLSDTTTVSGTVTVTSGTLSINSRTLNVAQFTAAGSTTRVVSFTAGGALNASAGITLSGSGLTWTPSSGTVTLTGGTLTVSHASLTLGAHVFTPANGATITVDTRADTTFGSVTCNGSSAGTGAVVWPASSTVTGAFTTTGNSSVNRLQLWEPPWGGIATISAGSASLSNTDFHNIVGAGAATWTGTNTGFTYTGWRQQAIVTT